MRDWKTVSSLRTNFSLELGKAFPARDMPRGLARIGLPAADYCIDIKRIELDAVAGASGALGGNERRAAAEKGIEHERATVRAVEDRIGNEGDGFDRRMQTQKNAFLGLAPEAGAP